MGLIVGMQHGRAAPLFGASALIILSSACGRGGRSASARSDSRCDVAVDARRDTGTIVVRGDKAPCSLEFRHVVRLSGKEGEPLPKPPIALGPGGEWLTATYDPGQVAVWSASGAFERVFGKGPGQGPGQFARATDIEVDSLRGSIYVFTGSPAIEVYSLAGEFQRRVILTSVGVASFGVVLSDGTIVASAMPSAGRPELVVIRGDSTARVGPAQRGPLFPPTIQAARTGVWSAEAPWYEVDHHRMPDGTVDFRLRREVAWFPDPTQEQVRALAGPQLVPFAVDAEHGLIYACVQQVKDPHAPSHPMSRPKSMEEGRELSRAYLDGVIEVFTVDGHLLASKRYDYGPDEPSPISSAHRADLWYHVEDDSLRSIEVVTPVLARSG